MRDLLFIIALLGILVFPAIEFFFDKREREKEMEEFKKLKRKTRRNK